MRRDPHTMPSGAEFSAMGGAAMVGLGLALAQPKRPVVVLMGDGEALMGLGALTIAVKKPLNLKISVLENGHFGETGMQLSHSGLGSRLDIIAQGAGFSNVTEVTDMNAVESYRSHLHDIASGPRFALIKISPGNPEGALPPRDGTFVKNRLRQHLGYQVSDVTRMGSQRKVIQDSSLLHI